MKRYIRIIMCVIILISATALTVSADDNILNGTVIGKIYATDIIAYIDDIPIQSYNIGGRTAIVVEDLKDYGFVVEWNNESRDLIVTTISDYTYNSTIPDNIENSKEKSGTPIGNIYSTDIVTIINGVLIPSYNIGGRTVVILEDIGLEGITDLLSRMSPPDNIIAPGYTYAGFYTEWDSINRTIKTYTARHLTGIVNTDFGEVEIFDVINEKGNNLYYNGAYNIYEVEEPQNEYAAIHAAEYGATIGNIGININNDPEINPSQFFHLESLLGYMGLEYNIDNNILNITMKEDYVSLNVLSYNLYNTQRLKSPMYSTEIEIAVNGDIVPMPDDVYAVIVYQSHNAYYLYINLEALELALGTNVFNED